MTEDQRKMTVATTVDSDRRRYANRWRVDEQATQATGVRRMAEVIGETIQEQNEGILE